jgi:hypothetical protein
VASDDTANAAVAAEIDGLVDSNVARELVTPLIVNLIARGFASN